MIKSEAERIIRRQMEETGAEFTEEQITALCHIIIKIGNQIVEEALASQSSGKPGSKPQFFA